MKIFQSKQVNLETLESRICPALTIRSVPGTLMITGIPSSTTTALEITQVGGAGNNLYQIMDGTANLGTWRVTRDLIVNMPSRLVDLEIDINGGVLPGNLTVSLGNGYTSAAPRSVELYSTAAGGRVGGSVTILGGNGRETISIGDDAGTTLPVIIGANLTVVGRAAGGITGDVLTLHGGTVLGIGSEVRGNMTTANIDNVTIGDQNLDGTARVGKNLSINLVGANTGLAANVFGTVNGNVSVNAPTVTTLFHQFTIQNQTVAIDSRIDGNLSVNLGPSGAIGNLVNILSSFGGPGSIIGGNASLISTSAAPGDLFTLDGTIFGSATVDMGAGDNILVSDIGVVAGNLLIRGGNGDNLITGTIDGFAAAVSGNLTVLLGNGNNTATLALVPGGKLTWRSGNGTDFLTLGSTLTPANVTWNVDLLFGSGDDTLTLAAPAPATQTLVGRVNGGGGTNTFVQDGWVLSPTLLFTF